MLWPLLLFRFKHSPLPYLVIDGPWSFCLRGAGLVAEGWKTNRHMEDKLQIQVGIFFLFLPLRNDKFNSN